MLLPLLLASLATLRSISGAAVQLPFGAASDPPHVLQQPDASSPVDWPYRDLEWGEVNVLSTTDTHGWLMGHQRQEASFSGDWGDLYSFVTRMKAEARRRGVDLLLVDSGDRVDGNGLVDAEPEGHVKGWTAMKYFEKMPYDVITTGNHELYKYPVALSVYENLAQHYASRYVSSNVNITLKRENGTERTVYYGNRFRKWRTEQGRKVTAFGPLFDFKAHAAGITVQPPTKMIKERWFLDAIADEPSFFLMVGHMSIRESPDSAWSSIVQAIRAVHPTTPILIFGGHHHVRDCSREDSRSMSLAAGRYMETVGWMSVKGLEDDPSKPLDFSRRYLDQNRNTYKYHAGANFDTDDGVEISESLTRTARDFNLTLQFGTAPQSYYLYRHPVTSDQSIFKLLTTRVLPLLVTRPDRPYPTLTILNTGSVRFDIFKGPFTRNDQWIVLPFTNSFEYVGGVPRSTALKLLPFLNLVGEHTISPSSIAAESTSLEQHYRQSLLLSYQSHSPSQLTSVHLTTGYVTVDLCDGLGDDTLHRPIPAAWQPTFVSTELAPVPEGEGEEVDEEEKVDVVFFDFIRVDVLNALNTLQLIKKYDEKDVGLYVTEFSANTLMQEYAKREWN